jgi:predicted nucleotidyltransferase
MRLSDFEITAIRDVAAQIFGRSISVWLFGSRVDDSKRGGDIDLLIVAETDQSRLELLRKETDFLVTLKNVIGEQKIDFIVATPASLETDPFLRTLSTRIPLTGIHAVKVTKDLIETSRLFLKSFGESCDTPSLEDYIIFSEGRIVAMVEIANMDQTSGEIGARASKQTLVSNEKRAFDKHIKRVLAQEPNQTDDFKSLVLAELIKRTST